MMADRIIFVCMIVLVAIYFYATSQIPSLEIGDPLGPKAFPYLLGISLLIATGVLFAEMLAAKKEKEPHKTAVLEKEQLGHLLVIAGVTAWTGVYFAVLEAIGHMITTAVYLLPLFAYFNRGRWMANILTSVLFSIGSYLLFVQVLGVTLAKGILSF